MSRAPFMPDPWPGLYFGENADSLALITAQYRAAGCAGMEDGAPLLLTEIPVSLRRKCVECKSPVDDQDKRVCDYCERNTDESDTRYLDDPRRGQAAWINSQR